MAAAQTAEEFLQKLLAKMSPEDEQYLLQLLVENAPAAGPLREVVQNILDERIPLEERLPKPLLPRKYPPKVLPRQRRGIKRQTIRKEFHPIQPIKNREKSYEDMLANLFKRGEEEEGEEKDGRCYIFWRKKTRT